MRIIKVILKIAAVVVVAILVARTAIGSGLVKAGLETSVGNAIYVSLKRFFGVAGGEDAEGFAIDLVFIVSLLLVTCLTWLLSKLRSMMSRSKASARL